MGAGGRGHLGRLLYQLLSRQFLLFLNRPDAAIQVRPNSRLADDVFQQGAMSDNHGLALGEDDGLRLHGVNSDSAIDGGEGIQPVRRFVSRGSIRFAHP
jgi:hypothetical protein